MVDIKEIGNRVGDTSDLPQELLKQLKLTYPIAVGKQVVVVLQQDLENIGTIDEIIVGIYKRYKKVVPRRTLRTELSRLKKLGTLKRINQGIYSVKEEQ